MNQGVEILLARIDSNPEEFLLSSRKWEWLGVDGVKPPYLTDAEWVALQVKVQTIRANEFTERVMTTLLQEETLYPDMATQNNLPLRPTTYDMATSAYPPARMPTIFGPRR